ncbi:MAG TPA: DUF5671 domain-containing protein [Candidatus Paceibacterota bacterium]|nr:DUF5671 domain-containing protein [Candidatus Paceibacterota bacterium]
METTTQKPSLTPKFFFVSMGVIVTLITSVSSLLVLLFETLDHKFPDALNSVYQYGYNTYNFDKIRGALATMIIVFPVFLLLSFVWRKICKGDLGRVDAIIRKWMIYLILFLSGVVVVVDLVTLVRYFVSGEITNRFIFKVIGTAVVALLVGFHYYFELKIFKLINWKKRFGLITGAISVLLVLGMIILSFMVMGSPSKQRDLRFDQRRVEDLQNIQYQVINYWQQKEKLPSTLAELANPISSYSIPVDPEFEKGNKYEYTPKDKLSFELCATFGEEMQKGWQEYGNRVYPAYDVSYSEKATSVAYPSYGGVNESWDHGVGRTCFTRTIDTDIYPPFEKRSIK